MSLTTAPSKLRRWSATIRGVFLGRVAPGPRSPHPAAAAPAAAPNAPARAVDADGVSFKFISMESGDDRQSLASDEDTPWDESSGGPGAGGGACDTSSTWPAASWHIQGQAAGKEGSKAEAPGSARRHMRRSSAEEEAAQYKERVPGAAGGRPRRQSSRAATAMDGVLDGTRRQGPGPCPSLHTRHSTPGPFLPVSSPALPATPPTPGPFSPVSSRAPPFAAPHQAPFRLTRGANRFGGFAPEATTTGSFPA